MRTHRFILILFIAGLVVFCASYFLMQKRFDVATIGGASVYGVGIITSVIGYSLERKKQKKQDVPDSLP